jgi:hypothetical protein
MNPEPSVATIINGIITLLMTATGFFLKGTASDLKQLRRDFDNYARDTHGRLSSLESWSQYDHPHRRRYDSGQHSEES